MVSGAWNNQGLILRMTSESNASYGFASSDHATAAYRPELVIEYTVPEPTATPDPGYTRASYTYSAEHPHAVSVVVREGETTAIDTYAYDEAGNQTCRVENGSTYLQFYNDENRFSAAWLVSGTCAEPGTTLAAWTFTYDGDGSRVKQEYTDGSGTLTTYYFFGGAYEVETDGSTETICKYYAFGGQVIAMEEDGERFYLLTDHLGSVVGVTDETGDLVSQSRYLPFGLVREDVGALITDTDFGYTGQRNLDAQQNAYSLGLMDYKARFYDPYVYRFTQPDSLVPNLYAPQSLDRYAYVLNNPVRYNDPTGHMCSDPEDPTPTCEGRIPPSNSVYDLVKIVDPSIVGNYPEPLEDGLVLREVDEPSSAPQALDKLWDDNSWCPDLEIGCVGEYLEYYMATFGTAIPNSITGTVVGWHISLAVDQFDQWYVGIGLDAGKNVLGVSFSIVEGRFDGNQLPEDDKGEKAFIESFLTGNSLQGFLVPIMYLGANYSLSGKKTAFEIGLGVPQAGGAWTYSFNLSKFVNQIEGASR